MRAKNVFRTHTSTNTKTTRVETAMREQKDERARRKRHRCLSAFSSAMVCCRSFPAPHSLSLRADFFQYFCFHALVSYKYMVSPDELSGSSLFPRVEYCENRRAFPIFRPRTDVTTTAIRTRHRCGNQNQNQNNNNEETEDREILYCCSTKSCSHISNFAPTSQGDVDVSLADTPERVLSEEVQPFMANLGLPGTFQL